ncbi:DNA methyltransferase [Methylobacterium sp. Leaf94]|uniref:DNA adenine methylase n=1 Tax=Methylobacterium sp. Leaf94 TaxID=1736250 RepID=UPI000700B97B|nr:DNA adenine methylase [Methylobacterium sp. Leaf94]KQU17570.1 DNA methyltransferase [Methylobacterium sp. Leaf94]
MSAPSRPLLRWFGGKWRLAPWVISHMPPHALYCEPFGGAASVLMRKPKVRVEVLGDLDDELITLFRVVRDPAMCARLAFLLVMTPWSDAEFELAYQPVPADEPVERARRLLVRHAMGVTNDVRLGRTRTGFRRYTAIASSTPALDWHTFPDALPAVRERLRSVVIERSDAVDTIRRHDRPDALFYVDPPYVPRTRRDPARGYAHEMDEAAHSRLLDCLGAIKGMVIVSGYADPLYEDALRGWKRVTKDSADIRGKVREEVLWISPKAVEAFLRTARQPDLFTMDAA